LAQFFVFYVNDSTAGLELLELLQDNVIVWKELLKLFDSEPHPQLTLQIIVLLWRVRFSGKVFATGFCLFRYSEDDTNATFFFVDFDAGDGG